ncbi:MAG: flippase-like domain-containing protein [Deltaproteobacteria bacterium]|nr:flippase-like domain-containing protein [Deltaproteobacteria bacterium]
MPPSKRSSKKQFIVGTIQIVVALTLLMLLLLPQNAATKVLDHLKSIDPFYVGVLLLISLCTNFTNSLKWRLFVTGGGQSVSYWRMFKMALIGRFFNNFMPGMVGGDIARILMLGEQIGSHSRSAATVFMERAVGLVGLVLIAILASIANPGVLQYWFVSLPLAAGVLGCAAMLTAYFSPRFSGLLVRMCKTLPLLRNYTVKAERLIEAFFMYRLQSRTLILSLLLAMFFHFAACLNVYVASLAIHFHPSFWDVLVITPVILLVTSIPVSPRGVGWWEWSFGVLFAGAGGSADQGVAAALTLRATAVLMSLLGGIFFVTDRGLVTAKAPVSPPQVNC